jgi:hypothetical protein
MVKAIKIKVDINMLNTGIKISVGIVSSSILIDIGHISRNKLVLDAKNTKNQDIRTESIYPPTIYPKANII